MQGRIDTDTLKHLVADDEIDPVIAAFPDMYGRLVGKRIVGRYFVDEVIAHGLHACDYLLACDMDMDPVPGYAFTSWAKGYGDLRDGGPGVGAGARRAGRGEDALDRRRAAARPDRGS